MGRTNPVGATRAQIGKDRQNGYCAQVLYTEPWSPALILNLMVEINNDRNS